MMTTPFIQTHIHNNIGWINLNRPKALNALSLEMIRSLSHTLLSWQQDKTIEAVFIYSEHERAFCAGGDIRFFYDLGVANAAGGALLIEDFFTEEYFLNYIIHRYPKPYIALLNGVVMGGGMGIVQAQGASAYRIVTEHTKMAMPEVNIGLFPDVGGSFFLSRCPGKLGTYLALTGETIGGKDAIYAELADYYLPSAQISALHNYLATVPAHKLQEELPKWLNQHTSDSPISDLAQYRGLIDHHFSHNSVTGIFASLKTDDHPFAQKTYHTMQQRSPLSMCITLEQLRRGAHLSIAECLRMERTMVRRCFESGDVVEGVRALIIDKDKAPKWQPAQLSDVTSDLIERFFTPAWPDYAHPLRDLV